MKRKWESSQWKTRHLLHEIRTSQLITAQKRTSNHKCYVVFESPDLVLKGPYKLRATSYDLRRFALMRANIGNLVYPLDFVVDADNNWWYVFQMIGEAPKRAMEYCEATSMGGAKVIIADLSSTHVRRAIDVWKANPDDLTKILDDGCRKTLIALFALGVGDVQPGSNWLVYEGVGYLIDFEENSDRDIERAPLDSIFFKNDTAGGCEFRGWMLQYIKSRRDKIFEEILELQAGLFGPVAAARLQILLDKVQNLH